MSPCLVVSEAGLESSSMHTREPYASSTQPMPQIDSINSFKCPMSIPNPALFPSYTPMSEHLRTHGYKRCSSARNSMMALLEAIIGPSSSCVIAAFWVAFMALQVRQEGDVYIIPMFWAMHWMLSEDFPYFVHSCSFHACDMHAA